MSDERPKIVSLVVHKREKAARDENPSLVEARSYVEAFQQSMCSRFRRGDGNPMDLEAATAILKKYWDGPISPWHTREKERIARCPFKEGDRIQYKDIRYQVAIFRPNRSLVLYRLNKDGGVSSAKATTAEHGEINQEKNWPEVKVLTVTVRPGVAVPHSAFNREPDQP